MIFSIIIPTCNRNELLGKCLDQLHASVQNFSADQYEVIVSDDSKSNGAKDFIDKHYSWVKWVEGPKRGPAANRNNGAKIAKGEWLIFLDDDCEPDNNLLKSYDTCILNNPIVKIIEGRITTSRAFNHSMETAPINESGGRLWSCNFCIIKNYFFLIGCFDETYRYPHLEDSDFAMRVQGQFLFCKEAYVTHPPRKLPSGVKLGYYHEYDIYFFKKFNIDYSLYKIIMRIFKTRMGGIRNTPISKYSVLSIYHMVIEILIVILNYNKWELRFIGMNL